MVYLNDNHVESNFDKSIEEIRKIISNEKRILSQMRKQDQYIRKKFLKKEQSIMEISTT